MFGGNQRARNVALALVLLVCSILLAVEFLGYVNGHHRNQETYRAHGTEHGQNEVERSNRRPPGVIGFFVSSYEDNLAQWLMAVFAIGAFFVSILAVVYLRRTLTETRRIGQAQVRAYLAFEIAEYRIRWIDPPENGRNVKIQFVGKIRNSGPSPAFAVSIAYNITAPELGSGVVVEQSDLFEKGINTLTIPAGGDHSSMMAKNISIDRTKYELGMIRIRLSYIIKYVDVFDEDISTPLCSGTMGKHPNKDDQWVFIPDTFNREES